MDSKERREKLLEKLKSTVGPITGTALAKELGVSRQVIVTDFAILRASGLEVYATPQGYVLPPSERSKTLRVTLVCKHTKEQMKEELDIIIHHGGKILDVIVEHPVYGELKANLMLTSRKDLEEFVRRLADSEAYPLATVTGGIHSHTIEVPDEQALAEIKEELRGHGLLVD